MKRRPLISLGAALCLAAGFMASGARAQSYPTKPIRQVGNAPSIMLVPNNSPARTVKEWIDHARQNPGRLNYASSGNGTIVQLTAELFKSQANVFVVHIPYKGTALAIPDLPPEVVTRVNMAANQVLKAPEVVDRFTRLGIEPIGGTPAQFAAMLTTELAKWKKIINERKITLD